MRLVSAVITAALLASAITAVHRSAAPLLLGVGLAVAVTPMVLFLGGLVNPSGPEIAAALAFWVCSLVLVSRPGPASTIRSSQAPAPPDAFWR